MTIYNLKRFLLDIVYPNKCPFCGEIIPFNQFYCRDCPESLNSFSTQPENEKDKLRDNITDTFSIFEYNDVTRGFVHSLKNNSDGYAISAAARLLNERIGAELMINLITCIPTDSKRMNERGYNPPALIATELAAMRGIPCNTKLLIKTRRTEIQKTLSEEKRRENLRGAFDIRKKGVHIPERILLTDDVRTTGATLSEAAGCLLSAGAKSVHAAVVADTSMN
ncbi:MAG: ComF family protein [Oscillospiraceae bacterium]|nr:ComF family protein [Oscillospiraceae bacterium]